VSKTFGDKEAKIYLKQAFLNYILLVLNDPRDFLSSNHKQKGINFDFQSYIHERDEEFRHFYEQLCET